MMIGTVFGADVLAEKIAATGLINVHACRWFFDARCTNCDTARQLAAGLIGEVEGRSAMLRQPDNRAETAAMLAAAFACPSRLPHEYPLTPISTRTISARS